MRARDARTSVSCTRSSALQARVLEAQPRCCRGGLDQRRIFEQRLVVDQRREGLTFVLED
jgi:hypothetical protein